MSDTLDRWVSGRRIAFVFKAGREARSSGAGPTEFFYGCVQLQSAGYQAEIVTDRQLDLDRPPGRLLRSVSHGFFRATGVPLWPLIRLARGANRRRLAPYDCLVVTTNTFGICLGLLRRLGMIRAQVMFVAMGLVEPTTPLRLTRIYAWIFRDTVAVRALSAANAKMLSIRLAMPVTHIPFGVDNAFWVPGRGGAATTPYVLSIGNDSHRDYQVLLEAWKPEYPTLRIVTSHPVTTAAPNIEVLRGGWHQQLVTDEQVRTLMQEALFVILPIKNTVQPSGQSACLQAMSCGKAVVITDFPGLWNRELLRDGETCVFGGRPGDPGGIQRAVERLIADGALAKAIGTMARGIIESDLNVNRMAEAIATDIGRLTADRHDG